MLIAFAHIIIVNVQVCLFRDGHAGMSQNLTQSVNVHSVHQASFGEVIPQTMGRELLIQARADQIFLEVAFEIAHLNVTASFSDREEIFTVHNTPTSCSDDDDVEAFIARMTKAVMTSADIDLVCSYLFDLYMAKVLYGDKILDKRLRITRMKIARGRKLDYDFNHKKINIVIPELKRGKDLIGLDPADSDGTLGIP